MIKRSMKKRSIEEENGAHNKTRDSYIDAVKGVGIISVVLGHACGNVNIGKYTLPIGPFVYLYHLAIFAFCTGYVYKSNSETIWVYVARRLKSMYCPFVLYSVIYIACRNIFIGMGILEAEPYDVGGGIIALTNIVAFNGCGELLGALWFVPMFFFSNVFFSFIDKSVNSLKVTRFDGQIIVFIATMIIGVVGLYATGRQFGLLYNIQIAYLFVPIILFGNLSGKIKLKQYCGAIVGCITFFIMAITLHSNIGFIELSQNMIINKWVFYPITIIGILFCLSITKVLCRNKKLETILAAAGKNSFDIMALHFICFKLIDFIICKSFGKDDVLAAFPHSFDSIWLIYVLGGVGIPLFLIKVKNRFKAGFQK